MMGGLPTTCLQTYMANKLPFLQKKWLFFLFFVPRSQFLRRRLYVLCVITAETKLRKKYLFTFPIFSVPSPSASFYLSLCLPFYLSVLLFPSSLCQFPPTFSLCLSFYVTSSFSVFLRVSFASLFFSVCLSLSMSCPTLFLILCLSYSGGQVTFKK
jgi:hypothetical protein